jgi:uncharacterized protein
VGIQINDASRPTPIPIAQRATFSGADAKSAPTEVVGGEQEVQANVTLQISY